MSTTTHEHTLELDPETNLWGLAGIAYPSPAEDRILEDLLLDHFGSADRPGPSFPDLVPPF